MFRIIMIIIIELSFVISCGVKGRPQPPLPTNKQIKKEALDSTEAKNKKTKAKKNKLTKDDQ